MAFEPCRLVGGDREGVGVGLGEHIVTVDLVEDPVGNISGDAIGERPLQEPAPVHGYQWSLLGRAKARRISSASEVFIPDTSDISCTTCSCQTMIPHPRSSARRSSGWS